MQTMSPRPNVSEQRKSQILEAAAAVFSQTGFSAARMEDIAQEAGLSKGTLYLYFKSKDELKTELMRRYFSVDAKELRALETAQGTATVRLLRYVDASLERFAQIADLFPIINEFYAVATRSDEVREFFAGTLHSYRESTRAIIQQGIDRGEFSAVDANQATTALSALYEGTILLSVIDPANVNLSRDLKPSIMLFLQGLIRGEAG
jgi:TetR/AcrR family fatty acid metabolism transcriptional regulator